MNNFPKTRREAKEVGAVQYYTGKPCKRGHLSPKFTSSGSCVRCMSDDYQTRQDIILSRSRQWYADNRELTLKRNKINWNRWYTQQDNRQRHNTQAMEWQQTHREHTRAARKRWREKNPHKYALYEGQRRATKMQRTPSWFAPSDQTKIEELYQQAQHLTEKTGVKHVVDHYYPLQGENVSGLHHPANLQVISEAENASKSNKHPEDFYVDSSFEVS